MKNEDLLFYEYVGEILKKLCLDDKFLTESEDKKRLRFRFLPKNVMQKLKINDSPYIYTKFFKHLSIIEFKRICRKMVANIKEKDDLENDNIFLITNLSSIELNRYLSIIRDISPIRFISIDEILELIEYDNDSFFIRNKCISNSELNDLLLFLIRMNLVRSAGIDSDAISEYSSYIPNDGQNLLPFAFIDSSRHKTHLFLNKYSKIFINHFRYDDNNYNPSIHIVRYSKEDDFLNNFKKVDYRTLMSYLKVFKSSKRFNIIPNKLQYKYRSFGKLDKESHLLDKGAIGVIEKNEVYFSPKSKLNDPFDIDADFYGRISPYTASNYRIFCVTDNSDNLVMWSHYGDSHKGFCVGYSPKELLYSINSNIGIDFCVYGYIDYKKKRQQEVRLKDLFLRALDKNLYNFAMQIKQLFRKSKDWEYENEFRYVIALNEYSTKDKKDDGVSIKVNPKIFYFGANYEKDSALEKHISNNIKCPKYKFQLSKKEYKVVATTYIL